MEIQVDGIQFGYDSAPILNDLRFTVTPGEVVGIVGPNGSGKSTLLQVMSRTLSPKSGAVYIAQENLANIPRRRLAKQMAVVRQHEFVAFDFTVQDTVLMGRDPHLRPFSGETAADMEIAASAMRLAGISELAERRVSCLSGGERQRVALARALAQEASILLLDEPTSSLDLKYQVETLSILRQLAAAGRTIVVVLHELNLASQFCDQLLVLSAGSIVQAGKPAAVLQTEVLEKVYGVQTLVTAHPQTGKPVVLPQIPLQPALTSQQIAPKEVMYV